VTLADLDGKVNHSSSELPIPPALLFGGTAYRIPHTAYF